MSRGKIYNIYKIPIEEKQPNAYHYRYKFSLRSNFNNSEELQK